MLMEISSFDDLLAVARMQPVPQRLLFVFARAVLPKEADASELERFQAGSGGGLQPLMSVDLRPERLASFEALVEEAARMGDDRWQLVFVSALDGSVGRPPAREKVEPAIEYMIRTIQDGGDIGRFLAFDREGEPLRVALAD
jgi:hypothetical protein